MVTTIDDIEERKYGGEDLLPPRIICLKCGAWFNLFNPKGFPKHKCGGQN